MTQFNVSSVFQKNKIAYNQDRVKVSKPKIRRK